MGDINDTSYPSFIAEVGALAMGFATYEWIVRHSEKMADETGSAWPYTQSAWVFSSRKLPAIEGAGRLTSPSLRLMSVRQVGAGFAELRYLVPRDERGDA